MRRDVSGLARATLPWSSQWLFTSVFPRVGINQAIETNRRINGGRVRVLKMIKTEKILHLKSCRGRKVRVVREHYLRERVPCFSSVCQADCVNGTASCYMQTHTHTSPLFTCTMDCNTPHDHCSWSYSYQRLAIAIGLNSRFCLCCLQATCQAWLSFMITGQICCDLIQRELHDGIR